VTLTRKQNWPEVLNAYVTSTLGQPFQWGLLDCCIFPANCVQAMTDVDLAADWLGKYSTRDEMMAYANTKGLNGVPEIIEYIAAQFNIPETKPKLAKRGDILLFESNLGPTLGIMLDARIAAMGLRGPKLLSPGNIYTDPKSRAWRIG
jgi:hypothetical protein